MAQYKIHPIVMGTKIFDKTMMTYQFGYGQKYTIPIYSWYIEGSGKNILIDTGEMNPIKSENRESAIGGKIFTFEEGLNRFDLKAQDIDIIIHTHLHNDHCENDYKCSNAVIYVHENELKSIHNPHPLDYRYLEDYITDVEENGQIKIVTNDMEIEHGIRIFHTPAHTLGGLSIAIETSQGLAVITGCCTIEENFNPAKEIVAMGMDVIPPGTHVNTYEAFDILVKIKKMADILIPLHEPKFAAIETITK